MFVSFRAPFLASGYCTQAAALFLLPSSVYTHFSTSVANSSIKLYHNFSLSQYLVLNQNFNESDIGIGTLLGQFSIAKGI